MDGKKRRVYQGPKVILVAAAGIVGLPNVGKSSLINSLKRARVVHVGNAPGVTRSMQQVNLDKHINLLDSPGIVFSAGDPTDTWAALRNCVKVSCLFSVPGGGT